MTASPSQDQVNQLTRQGAVCTLTANRPSSLNSLSLDAIRSSRVLRFFMKKATDQNQWLFHFGGPTKT